MMYLLVCEIAGSTLAFKMLGPDKLWIGVVAGFMVAILFIMIDNILKEFTIRHLSTATLGLLLGLACAWLLQTIQLTQLFTATFGDSFTEMENLDLTLRVCTYATMGFMGTVIALRSSPDDVALVIPYVQFRAESRPDKSTVVDATVLVDPRLTGIANSGFFGSRFVIPRFVLNELQEMRNSDVKSRSQRGERGLELLREFQTNPKVDVRIHDGSMDVAEENRILHLCSFLQARLLTCDDALSKLAKVQEIEVMHLNQIAEVLRPQVEVGSRMQLSIVRPGKEDHQGVGYLDDGTMIVVNHAYNKIGSALDVTVISTINTSAGTMVFAEETK
ncbi:hypothetical protein [Rubritalea marina]|uniref:hypothetical protein n=1 Tax=Rubritalea marina TaxID=361055 RepID=UPI00036C65A2|nr:hypothetical protein [Rubritalea marina]